jgi:proteasome lid subunit RPN8/RPN11
MSSPCAEFLRHVLPHEPMSEIVAEAKHLTWENYCEVALLQLDNGRRVLVRGQRTSVELEQIGASDPLGRSQGDLYLDVEGESMRIVRLIFHTHPIPTGGPSDADLAVLELLGQEDSMLYELFGPLEGTVIRPKRK